MSLLNELKRRNVFRVGAAYVVVAWLVIQVVETILPAFGFGVAAVRIVTIAFGIGLVPTLIFAWAFEMTPEGLKKESEVDRTQSIPPYASKKLDRMIMVVLALALGYFAFDKFVLDPSRDATELESAREEARTEAVIESFGVKSIAVIPFLNLSSDSEQAFFADGVAEEILNLLAKIPELRVISRSSSFTFRGDDVEIPEIGRRLNAAHILEGSVRRAGNRIRITAQLIEANSDTHLWSGTFERTLDDIFAIQDEIAAHIVESLKVELVSPMPASARTDPVALALTIQAKQVFYQYFAGNHKAGAGDRMAALLDRALELDPQYAPAMGWYGYANWMRLQEGLISPEETQRRFDVLAERALAIDPEQAIILQQMAWMEVFENANLESAAPLYERALRSAPNDSEVLRHVGRFLMVLGRYEASLSFFERAVELDPLCRTCLWWLSRAYMVVGKLDKAEVARKHFLLIGGGGGHYYHGVIKLLQGDAEAALDIFEDEEIMNDPESLAGKAMALHALGRFEESEAALAVLIGIWKSALQKEQARLAKFVAQVFAWKDDNDSAFEWLNMWLDYGSGPGNWTRKIGPLYEPIFRSLHGDPRWEKLRERIDVPAKRIETLKFSAELPK